MKDRIIIALDTPTFEEAESIIAALIEAECFKVGLQAYLAFGERIIDLLATQKKKIFLDLKFHDIPNTVSGAVRSILKHHPFMTTIHMAGGRAMAKSAVKAASDEPDLTVLGVTVLTSIDRDELSASGITLSPAELVKKHVGLGLESGVKGFVCSPQEVALIRNEFGRKPLLVTPGVRPHWSAVNDQKRVFTPQQAIQAGSDYLVIGRPVTHHPSPGEAFRMILEEMKK